MSARAPSPDHLPPGFLLDRWRVRNQCGRGSYGAVYRAQHRAEEDAGPVALKLALHPRDERFAREADLLARVRHPGVPQLLARGELTCGPEGLPHPYLVMEWVDGAPLYGAYDSPRFTLRGALQALLQVARALAALHAVGGLHRDVKGENVLVEASGRAVLVDFGCGTWVAAPPLTQGPLPPGTPRYRAPQALRWQARHWKSRKRYEATPADDVYALGVMAYRLVTGHYPGPEESSSTDPAARRPPAHLLNRQVPLALSTLIERLLSDAPRARGSAAEATRLLEDMATQADDLAPLIGEDVPLALPRMRAQRPRPPRRLGLPLVVPVLVGLLTCYLAFLPRQPEPEQADAGVTPEGAVGVADAAMSQEQLLSAADIPGVQVPEEGLGRPMPKSPLEGQRRPPCMPRIETAIQGACWVRVGTEKPPCGPNAFDHEGACYIPSFTTSRPSTSDKP